LGFEGDAPFQFGVQIASARQKHGRDYVKDLDGLIAAVALDNNACTVATRDVRPFEAMGVAVVNAWQSEAERILCRSLSTKSGVARLNSGGPVPPPP